MRYKTAHVREDYADALRVIAAQDSITEGRRITLIRAIQRALNKFYGPRLRALGVTTDDGDNDEHDKTDES